MECLVMLSKEKNCSGSQSNKNQVNAYLDAFNSESWIAEFHFLFSSSTSTFRANFLQMKIILFACYTKNKTQIFKKVLKKAVCGSFAIKEAGTSRFA